MTKLYPFQKVGVVKLLKFNGRALLADEMGLGKTIQALTYLKIKRISTQPILVVCPACAKYVWRDEIRKHTGFSGRILSGQKPSKLKQLKNITIINYEILTYWKEVLKKCKFKTMILDECHYIKNRSAKRTRASISLGRKIPHILALSGTPITNRPKEFYPVLNLLLPKDFPAYVPYATRYCKRRWTPWGWDDTGASHIPELHKRVKEKCMIRRTKKEVLTQLPSKQRSIVPLPISAFDYRRVEIAMAEKMGKAKTSQQLIHLGLLRQHAAELKKKALTQWIDNFFENTNEKLVVFTYHHAMMFYLKDYYSKKIWEASGTKGISRAMAKRLQGKPSDFCVEYHGLTPKAKRHENIKKFQRNDNTRLFIGQITAAGTAITLNAASTVAFAELDWTPGNIIQAEDRVHRIGQTKPVMIYYLVAQKTIEEDLCHILQKKAETIGKTLDGDRTWNRLDIYDKLISNIYERVSK